MQKNILVISGSPKAKGSSANVLADAFIKGALKNRHHITKINLNKLKILDCNGCNKCFTNGTPCVLQDDMNLIYKAFDKAHLVVFATPIYFSVFPGLLKCAVDRFFAYGYASNYAYPKRDCMLLVASGDISATAFEPVINYYKLLTTKHFKWNNLGIITAPGVSESSEVVVHPAFKAAEELGTNYI